MESMERRSISMADYYQEQNYHKNGVIYCSRCGRQNKADNRFCIYCGNPMEEEPGNPKEEGPGNSMNRGPGNFVHEGPGNFMHEGPGNFFHAGPEPGFGAKTAFGQGGVIEEITEFCRSIPALVFYIIFSLYVLLNLIFNFGIGTFFASIPLVMFVIAVWLIFYSSYQRNLTDGGFRLISITLIIELVGAILSAIVGFGGVAVLFFIAGSAADDGSITVLGVITLLTGIVVCVWNWFYWMGLRILPETISHVLQGRETSYRTSLFSIIMLIIGGVFQFFGLILTLSLQSVYSALYDELYSLMSYGSYGYGYGYGGYSEMEYIMPIIQALLPKTGPMVVFTALLGFAVTVYSIVIIFILRSRNPYSD